MYKVQYTPTSNYPRRTGRTFRRLLSALVKASDGINVYYVNQDMNMCKWSFDKAMTITTNYLSVGSVANKTDLRIEFPTHGSVTFVTMQNLMNRKDDRGLTQMKMEIIRDEN